MVIKNKARVLSFGVMTALSLGFKRIKFYFIDFDGFVSWVFMGCLDPGEGQVSKLGVDVNWRGVGMSLALALALGTRVPE